MADFQSIVYQMILSVLRDAEMTSAGGDSPKTNTFKGLTTGGTSEIGLDEELREAIREIVGEVIDDPESVENLADEIKEKKKGLTEGQATSLASKGLRGAKNPASIVADGITMLPHAKLVAFAIVLAPLIVDQLTRPGGPLDLRFKRIISDEINGFLSRQTQKDTEMGVRQVIIQSKTGFTATNGKNNYNTVRGIREGGIDKERLDRIGMKDHAKGVFDFG